MSRFNTAASTCALALLIVVACGGPGGLTDANADKASRPEANAGSPETPAPRQEAVQGFTYNFDSDTAGLVPAKFRTALTGQGAKGNWVVTADPTAPSPPKVLAQ